MQRARRAVRARLTIEVSLGHALVSVRHESIGDVAMRPDADAGGCVVYADVGEENEHEQRSLVGSMVDPPRAVRSQIAAVDVPTVVSRVSLDRESDGEASAHPRGRGGLWAGDLMDGFDPTRRRGRFGEDGVGL